MPLQGKELKPQGVGGKPTNVKTFTKKYYDRYDRRMTDPKFIGPPKKLFQSYTMPKAKTATEIGKDIMKKTNVGAGKVLTALGSPIKTTKKILSKVKSKFTACKS